MIVELTGSLEREERCTQNTCNGFAFPLGEETQTRSLDDVLEDKFVEQAEEIKVELVALLEENDMPWIVTRALKAIDAIMVWNVLLIIWNFFMGKLKDQAS